MTASTNIRLLFLWAACGSFLIIGAALFSPVILVGCMFAPLLLADRRVLKQNLAVVHPVTILLALATAYLLVNASWSLDKGNAYIGIVMLGVLTAVQHVTLSALRAVPVERLLPLQQGMTIGLGLGALFLMFEFQSHMSLHAAMAALADHAKLTFIKLRPDAHGAPQYHELNRNLAALVMLAWALLSAQLRTAQWSRVSGAALVMILLLGATFSSVMATAKVALFVGAGALLLQHVMPALMLRALYAGWTILCLGAVPIAHLLFSLRLYEASWLATSARHRVVIWGATSDWYWKAPVFGAGVASARGLDAVDPTFAVQAPGLQQISMNWHSHNAYLQVWFEAGAVGAVLLLLIGLAVIREIGRARTEDQPILSATFATVATIAASAFSIWAAWYIAAIGLAAIYAVLATRFLPLREAKDAPSKVGQVLHS